eukprot:5228717-Amphidinium_carterae.1
MAYLDIAQDKRRRISDHYYFVRVRAVDAAMQRKRVLEGGLAWVESFGSTVSTVSRGEAGPHYAGTEDDAAAQKHLCPQDLRPAQATASALVLQRSVRNQHKVVYLLRDLRMFAS